MKLGQAETPRGMRLYAIGDVHGCASMLTGMHERIKADLAAHPAASYRIIHVGDYGDRGPDTASVISQLAALTERDDRAICLRGNHDQMLLDYLAHPGRNAGMFLANGGGATLASYHVAADDPVEMASRLGALLPARDRAFLSALPLTARFGDYLFVHAGIRPGVPLADQRAEDLLWIRDPFLFDRRDHGLVVVHGHTPAETPEVMPNRINIDTGAVYGGVLTCLVLEGTEYRFL